MAVKIPTTDNGQPVFSPATAAHRFVSPPNARAINSRGEMSGSVLFSLF